MEAFTANSLFINAWGNGFLRLLPDTLVEALGWTVVHALWQGTAVAVLLAIGLWLLRGRSALLRYGVAVAAQLLVLIAAVVTFSMSYEDATPGVANGGIPDFFSREIALQNSLEEIIFSIWRTTLHSLRTFVEHNLGWIAILWMSGVVFFSFRLMRDWAFSRKLVVTAVRIVGGEWQDRFDQIAVKMCVKGKIRLLESARIHTPMVIGHLKPVVLLPIGLLSGLPPAQVEALLIHELAHIQRRDYLVNLLLSVLETVFFFHPAIWWMGAVVRRERECCCDATTVRFSGDSLSYAKALGALPRWQASTPGMAMAATGRHKELLFRIRRILLPQSNYQYDIMEKTFATCLIFGAFFLLSLQAKPARVGEVVMVPSPAIAMPDSLPMGRIIIKQKKDGKSLEAKLQDGQIVSLNVDGREVPEAEFQQYEKEVMEMLEKLPLPPPPAPPTPPIPPRPGMRFYFGDDEETQREIIIQREGEDSLFVEINPGPRRKFRGWRDNQEISIEMKDLVLDMQDLELDMKHRMGEMARRFAEEGVHFGIGMSESFGDSLRLRMENILSDSFMIENLKDLRFEMDFNTEDNWRNSPPEDRGPRYRADEELGIYPYRRMRGMTAAQQIERALLRDELIEKTGMYKFELTDRVLKINGDKMPDSLRKKYTRLYEEASGMPWDPQNKVVIHTEVGNK